MNLKELRDRLIEDGIASVQSDPDMKEHEKRGSIRGFERCRSFEATDDFIAALEGQQAREAAIREASIEGEEGATIEDYWECRYETIQIELVWETLKVGLNLPGEPLYSSAIMRYARIVGVKEQECPECAEGQDAPAAEVLQDEAPSHYKLEGNACATDD